MTSSAISTDAEATRARGEGGAAAPRRRRRVPLLAWGLAGALVGGLYAALGEHMRFGPPSVMLALGGMTLAFTAAALWRVIDPLTRVETGIGAERARRPRRVRELEREKQLVLKAIKEVELDFHMRKVAERDYREMVERYRSRALRLMTELEAGDDYRLLIERELALRLKLPSNVRPRATEVKPAADSAPADPALCSGCGTRNDEDAQFCKKCGAKVG
jgi:ribosomal protein L40E